MSNRGKDPIFVSSMQEVFAVLRCQWIDKGMALNQASNMCLMSGTHATELLLFVKEFSSCACAAD